MGEAWAIVGASVVGVSHVRDGRGCEDAHAYRVVDDTAILGVADGAGSVARAAEGSTTAVRAAVQTVAELIAEDRPSTAERWGEVLHQAIEQARSDLQALALEPGGLNALATTLLVAVVSPSWLAIAQIGDGAIVIRTAEGMAAAAIPDHGEYINETHFLTSTDYLERLQLAVRPHTAEITGLALLTDGLEPLGLLMSDSTPHVAFFRPLFAFAASPDASQQELADFLDSERVCQRVDDDKTLLLAVPA